MPQLTLAQAFARGTKKSGSEKQPPPKQPNAAPKPQPSKPQITPPSPAQKILFGPSGPYAEFDQFAVHPITHNGVIYPTSQHLFQALKFIGHRPDIAALIREATTAQLAFDIAHSNKPLARVDWFSVNVSQVQLNLTPTSPFVAENQLQMEEVLFLKFTQYDHLKQQLIATGNAGLCQDSMTDSFWSVGPDLLGSNELGRALERVRERLGGSPAPVYTIAQCLVINFQPLTLPPCLYVDRNVARGQRLVNCCTVEWLVCVQTSHEYLLYVHDVGDDLRLATWASVESLVSKPVVSE